MKYATRIERFAVGDFPMVCARSGREANKLVAIQAYRSSTWLGLFFPGLDDSDQPWGLLPFADGEDRDVAATLDDALGTVILHGVHPAFVSATRMAQGKPPTG